MSVWSGRWFLRAVVFSVHSHNSGFDSNYSSSSSSICSPFATHAIQFVCTGAQAHGCTGVKEGVHKGKKMPKQISHNLIMIACASGICCSMVVCVVCIYVSVVCVCVYSRIRPSAPIRGTALRRRQRTHKMERKLSVRGGRIRCAPARPPTVRIAVPDPKRSENCLDHSRNTAGKKTSTTYTHKQAPVVVYIALVPSSLPYTHNRTPNWPVFCMARFLFFFFCLCGDAFPANTSGALHFRNRRLSARQPDSA